jgi:hypothetical protein
MDECGLIGLAGLQSADRAAGMQAWRKRYILVFSSFILS